ncbi:MAG: L-asparaginase [Planctomycetota bacterium]|jgi:L-asparaginase
MTIKVLTTGGTFDKIYFDVYSEFSIGEPIIGEMLKEANCSLSVEIESILKKDSIDMNDDDRQTIFKAVESADCDKILITHGTDTMVETARCLQGISDKTIVLFGAMQPARMRYSDAMYNLGVATMAVQLLPAGVHLAMNGQIFAPDTVHKNRAIGKFEETSV